MSSDSGSLSEFLAFNRSKYLDALRTGNGRDWTVVVGNEAGDLDSVASSIAYSYLASTLQGQPTVALLQTPRTDLYLRPENVYAYEVASLNSTQKELLCIDDIPSESLPHFPSSSFALVDHNRLVSRLSTSSAFANPPNVVAIIDHHEDEGFHKEAGLRLITTLVGSCSSLVTQHFKHLWDNAESPPPRELASLILCAIFIDTQGLKPGGKAVPVDHDAAAFLLPKSTFNSSLLNLDTESIRDNTVMNVIRTLNERKQTVSHFSSRDLLRRDYKEYAYQTTSRPTVHTKIGLVTVPLSPKSWLHKDASPKFWESMDAWIDERELDALGVLFTYNSPKGKHKRQGLWIVKHENEILRKTLWDGLENCKELKLERRDMEKRMISEGVERGTDGDVRTPKGAVARIWKQGNAKATRKVVAPLVKKLVENI